MFKILRSVSAVYMAYVSLLVAFVSLGAFVAALASESDLAGVAGISLVACFGGAVAGFRSGARSLAQSRGSGERADNVSIFSVPLRRDEIDQYLENYRADSARAPQVGRVMAVIAGGQSPKHVVSHGISRNSEPSAAGASRLSA